MSVAIRSSAAPGAFAPFGHVAFAVLWVATVASNVGTWMHDVGAAWLMTELSPSPLVVAAVQASTTLPMFMFALVAGAIADIVDRRHLLLVVNVLLAAAAVVLAALTAAGQMTPALLLAFTFAFGTGAAFIAPAWQAIVPQLVPRAALTPAIALNSLGINAARAIGPALAGVLIVVAGVAAPFAANAVSYAGIVAALLWWRSPPRADSALPRERLGGALVGGLRFALANRALKATLVRAAAFFAFASAYWAMLPLVARTVLGGGPSLYGALMGAAGAGAVAGALLMPRLKARLNADQFVAAGTGGMALTLVLFALVNAPEVAIIASLLAGASWIAVLTNLNVSAQTSLPDWVRARGLSVFITVFFGSMTVGSLLWGQVASAAGIPTALLAAAAGAVLAIPLTWGFKLMQAADVDHTASAHWPQPVVADALEPDRGPVLITVEYDVDPADSDAFVAAMCEVREERRRHGAVGWSLQQDAAEPHLWLETFRHGSWLEHERQHARVSRTEADAESRARSHHRGPEAPRVRHLLAPPGRGRHGFQPGPTADGAAESVRPEVMHPEAMREETTMHKPIAGLHHVTSICSSPQDNLAFYTGVLNQRLVKKTVNFDDPGTYHLYYADRVGSPGSVLTFFPFAGIGPGRASPGMASAVAYSVPAGGLNAWMEMLAEAALDFDGPHERFGAPMITLTDPDGMAIELAEGSVASVATVPTGTGPQIGAFHSVTLWLQNPDRTARLLTDVFGMSPAGSERTGDDERLRFAAPGYASVDLLRSDAMVFGQQGAGTFHHVAFRAKTRDDQLAWREALLSAGLQVTPVIDRQYFDSIYFREPGGVLFEIATDPPGFAIDEDEAHLGEALKLPPQYERRRASIARILPPLTVPGRGKAA